MAKGTQRTHIYSHF